MNIFDLDFTSFLLCTHSQLLNFDLVNGLTLNKFSDSRSPGFNELISELTLWVHVGRRFLLISNKLFLLTLKYHSALGCSSEIISSLRKGCSHWQADGKQCIPSLSLRGCRKSVNRFEFPHVLWVINCNEFQSLSHA